jgi:hypothetical protein
MSLREIGFYVACRFTERKLRESLEFIWNLEEKSNKNFELFLYKQQFRRCYYAETYITIMHKHFFSLFNYQIQPKMFSLNFL